MILPFHELQTLAHLNNTGVALLQRKFHRQAMEMFGDAIAVVRAASCHRVNERLALPTEHKCGPSYAATLSEKSRHAAQLLSMAQSFSTTKSTGIKVPHFEVVSDDESPTIITQLLRPSENGATLFHLVRIESVDFGFGNDDDNLALLSCILLYNYGIAYCHLSIQRSASHPSAQKLRFRAQRMLRISYATLGKIVHWTPCHHRILLLSGLTLYHLVNLSWFIREPPSGSSMSLSSIMRYRQRLRLLRRQILSSWIVVEQALPPPAAAAA